QQGGLVAFDGQHVLAAAVQYLLDVVAVRMGGVRGDDDPGQAAAALGAAGTGGLAGDRIWRRDDLGGSPVPAGVSRRPAITPSPCRRAKNSRTLASPVLISLHEPLSVLPSSASPIQPGACPAATLPARTWPSSQRPARASASSRRCSG